MNSNRKNAATLAHEQKCQARRQRRSMVSGLLLGVATVVLVLYATSSPHSKPVVSRGTSEPYSGSGPVRGVILRYANGDTEVIDHQVDADQSSSQ